MKSASSWGAPVAGQLAGTAETSLWPQPRLAPSSAVGMVWVRLGPLRTAIAEAAQASRAKTATLYQLPASPPIRAPAIDGVKPASAKPHWVPTAMPERRTLV